VIHFGHKLPMLNAWRSLLYIRGHEYVMLSLSTFIAASTMNVSAHDLGMPMVIISHAP
jgi:hypothetical protein